MDVLQGFEISRNLSLVNYDDNLGKTFQNFYFIENHKT